MKKIKFYLSVNLFKLCFINYHPLKIAVIGICETIRTIIFIDVYVIKIIYWTYNSLTRKQKRNILHLILHVKFVP